MTKGFYIWLLLAIACQTLDLTFAAFVCAACAVSMLIKAL